MRNFDLSPLYRSTVGFDRFGSMLDQLMSGDAPAPSYPPYNIEKTGEDTYRITLAVAGFAAEDLSVTVESNQLVIRGGQSDEEDRNFLHRGIAARQFQRAFVLAEGIEILSADLENGLLTISLEQQTPEEIVQQIEITTKGS